MRITIELTDREVQFLNRMVSDMVSFETINCTSPGLTDTPKG